MLGKETNSSSFDKKNRKRRADMKLKPKKTKKLKVGQEVMVAYDTYLSRKLKLKTPSPEDSLEKSCLLPPFVSILGFHVTYEDFYESFKRKGHISNMVMSMWTGLFNNDSKEAWRLDHSLDRKYAFNAAHTDKLKVDPKEFNQASYISGLLRLDKTWTLRDMHLLFFPIVEEDHGVLVCVNMFQDRIAFFNSINGSTDTPCFEKAKNVLGNFGPAAYESTVLRRDVSKFRWSYPTDYPQQKNPFDCGLFAMLFMESWDGQQMAMQFDPVNMADYRKHVAGSLLLSPLNEISAADFMKEHSIN